MVVLMGAGRAFKYILTIGKIVIGPWKMGPFLLWDERRLLWEWACWSKGEKGACLGDLG